MEIRKDSLKAMVKSYICENLEHQDDIHKIFV